MGFKAGRRRGNDWDDCKELDRIIRQYPFHTTGKIERDFEHGFATTLMQSEFKSDVITQVDKETTVQSVFCFGKKHRPDMTLSDSVAVELKYVTYAGLKDAIGQGFLYRLKFKFVFLVLIISEERSKIYYDLESKEERDLNDILCHLEDTMNIFTYVVPAFRPKHGVKKCLSYFDAEPTSKA